MRYRFTPGARRALAAAEACQPTENRTIEPASLLLGLLAEPECRAARWLADCGIDVAGVRGHWPKLGEPGEVPQKLPAANGWEFDSDVVTSLESVKHRLAAWPDPWEFATEHLLLGLCHQEHEAGRWLESQGVQVGKLEQEIARVHGYNPEPVDASVLGPPVDLPEELCVAETEGGAASLPSSDPVEVPNPDASHRPAPASCSPESKQAAAHEPRTGVYRALDASFNRAREAVRVIEDYTRFVLDDRHLTRELKQLRHSLTAALEQVPYGDRIRCRDTQADVGTTVSTPSEAARADAQAVLSANFARLSESLRSLEEYGKVLSPSVAAQIEQLRYRSYTLERAVQTTCRSQADLADARLYVLMDGGQSATAFESFARTLIDAGVDVVQLRDKQLDDRTLVARGRLLEKLTRDVTTRFIMNDRPDLAVLCNADGVHVGQEELSVKDARAILGPGKLIGVSTHSIEQARAAVLDGADYLGVGPTFPSQTKQFDDFPGLEFVHAMAAEIQLPWFAIGGITGENIADVVNAGAQRVAIGNAVSASHDVRSAIQAIRSALLEPRPGT